MSKNPFNKVLVVLSGANKLSLRDGKECATGYSLFDLATMVQTVQSLSSAPYELVFATPQGNEPSVEPFSVDTALFGGDAAKLEEAKSCLAGLPQLKAPQTLANVLAGGLDEYVGLFIPGGRAVMQDLCLDANLGEILKSFKREQKPVALIGHAPMVLLATAYYGPERALKAITDMDLKNSALSCPWYSNCQVTAFSTVEEQLAEVNQLGGSMRFYVDAVLRVLGWQVKIKDGGTINVVEDKELITGQNSASAGAVVEKFVAALKKRQELEKRRLVFIDKKLQLVLQSLFTLATLSVWDRLVEELAGKPPETETQTVVHTLETTAYLSWLCGVSTVSIPTRLTFSVEYCAEKTNMEVMGSTGVEVFLKEAGQILDSVARQLGSRALAPQSKITIKDTDGNRYSKKPGYYEGWQHGGIRIFALPSITFAELPAASDNSNSNNSEPEKEV